MTEQITIQLRLFASLRQAVGQSAMERTVDQGTTVADLVDQLVQEYPAVPGTAGAIYTAVNRSYVARNTVLAEGDEVALLPPVSGGQATSPGLFEITEAPLSLDDAAARVTANSRGAIALFSGVVRGETAASAAGGESILRTDYLEYEAYAEMAESMLAQIGAEVQEKWPQVEAICIMHRVGRLEVGEPSVVIAVAAAHRQGVFEACSYAIERLKAVVPIWKKEVGSDGRWWVEGPGHPDSIPPFSAP